jgi:hypothetical protein
LRYFSNYYRDVSDNIIIDSIKEFCPYISSDKFVLLYTRHWEESDSILQKVKKDHDIQPKQVFQHKGYPFPQLEEGERLDLPRHHLLI